MLKLKVKANPIVKLNLVQIEIL